MYNIYPKQIAKIRHTPKKDVCFVLMPFNEKFDEIYSEIKLSLKKIDFESIRADDIYNNRPIISTIVSEILSSHFVIADLTNKNPNVFYELGVAHSVRDIPNVVLIAQSMDFVPFDIRHLPVIIYDADNLRGLTSKLQRRILENKPYFEGHVQFRERYCLQVPREHELDELLDFFDNADPLLWEVIRALLSSDLRSVTDSILGQAITTLRESFVAVYNEKRHELFRNLLLVFLDVLRFFSGIPAVYEFVANLLNGQRSFDPRLPKDKELGIVTDIAIAMYFVPTLKNNSLEWLLNYLNRNKVAGVDLNRAKIESFIMTCGDHDMHQSLIFLLQNNNELLRETAADFVGELRLYDGEKSLVFLLDKEENPFVIRSIISALGKLHSRNSANAIINLINRYAKTIKDHSLGFVVDYAKEAINSIDISNGTSYEELLAKTLQNNDVD